LPEVFDDYSSFEQWFDLSSVTAASDSAAALSTAQAQHIVTSLHAILKPFLLRRVKSEVETNLPKKKE
jgi:ATP-dependent DNA helicase